MEGVVARVRDGLVQDQTERRLKTPEIAAQIDTFVQRLEGLLEAREAFTLEVGALFTFFISLVFF